MSRFFRGGDDSSSESSSDEEELYSSSEEEEKEEQEEQESSSGDEESSSDEDEDVGQKKGLSRFLVDQASSDEEGSEDEVTTKVKSAKDKRFDELEATITTIQNGQKINDWGSIATGMLVPLQYYAGANSTQNSTSSTARLPSSKMAARLRSRTSSASPNWRIS